MRTFSSSPPLHVHINESTPVHVHVKSTQRPSPIRSPQVRAWTHLLSLSLCLYMYVLKWWHNLGFQKGKTKNDPKGNLHPAAKAKTRVPWIPPGRSCTRDSTYKWEVMCILLNPFGPLGSLGRPQWISASLSSARWTLLLARRSQSWSVHQAWGDYSPDWAFLAILLGSFFDRSIPTFWIWVQCGFGFNVYW